MTTIETPAPPPRTRRGLVVVAVLFVVLVTGTGAAQLATQWLRTTFEQTSVLQPKADRLTVRSGSGDVVLTPSTDGNVTVHTVARYGASRPMLTEQSTPTGVVLESRCDGFLAMECEVAYTIAVPPSFTVAVDAGAGSVRARGLTGPVELDLSSGDVDLLELSGPLDVDNTAGEIRGARLRSEVVRATMASGDVRLDLLVPPRTVAVDVISGEVDIAVPGTEPYQVTTDSDVGEESVTVRHDDTATRTIAVDTSSGDIRVHPNP